MNIKTSRIFLWCILALTICALLFKLGSWGITESSEARYAQIAKEMIESKDFLYPKLLGIKHLHKPPLTYYITSLGYYLFGTNEFGARFFSQIGLIIQLILVYNIGLIFFNSKKSAIHAMLIYFGIPLVLISARNLTTDVFLNTFILGSIWSWLSYRKNKKIYFIYIFFGFLTLISHTKGPVGYLFPLLFILTYYIIFKKKVSLSIHHYIGFLLFILISSSWILFLYQSNHDIFRYFFQEQIADRIIKNSFSRAKPIWYFIILTPLLILPTLPLLLNKLTFRATNKSKTKRFLQLNWILILVIFSLFKTKLPLYILPISLYTALLGAHFYTAIQPKTEKLFDRFVIILIGLLGITILILPFLFKQYNISFSSVLGVLIITSIFIYLIQLNIFREISAKGPLMLYIFGLFLVLTSTLFFQQNELEVNSLKPVYEQIKNQEERPILVYNYRLASAPYYLNQKVITINDGNKTTKRDLTFETDENWRQWYIDIGSQEGRNTLDDLLVKNPIIICRTKNQLPKKLFEFTTNNQKQEIGKWTIYQ